jgi:hypothetical protein
VQDVQSHSEQMIDAFRLKVREVCDAMMHHIMNASQHAFAAAPLKTEEKTTSDEQMERERRPSEAASTPSAASASSSVLSQLPAHTAHSRDEKPVMRMVAAQDDREESAASSTLSSSVSTSLPPQREGDEKQPNLSRAERSRMESSAMQEDQPSWSSSSSATHPPASNWEQISASQQKRIASPVSHPTTFSSSMSRKRGRPRKTEPAEGRKQMVERILAETGSAVDGAQSGQLISAQRGRVRPRAVNLAVQTVVG